MGSEVADGGQVVLVRRARRCSHYSSRTVCPGQQMSPWGATRPCGCLIGDEGADYGS
jgi:hypothetical protein